MKRKIKMKILSLVVLFGLVLSVYSISRVQADTLQKEDEFKATMKTQYEFTDRYGIDYMHEISYYSTSVVTGVNSTWVNYTTSTRMDNYMSSASASNGGWTSYTVDGEYITSSEASSNRTLDPWDQYLYLNWMDYDTWNNNTAGRQFSNWNTTYYDQRFDYFDMEADNVLDRFYFDILTPNFVQDPTDLIDLVDDQWQALAHGDVGNLPILEWNRSHSWSNFRYNKFIDDVAYKARVKSSDDNGAEIIQFTPDWVGDYWYPDNSYKWNGTHWEPRVNPKTDKYATTNEPCIYNYTSNKWVLRENYKYFAESTLNKEREDIDDRFNNLQETFDVNSFLIEFDVEMEDINQYTYHPDYDKKRNTGNCSFSYEFEYHPDKGYLRKQKISEVYDFGNMGKYSGIMTLNPGISGGAGGTPGFELPVILLSIIPVVILLKKRRCK
ncbi:MAG: hypothetical protein ACXADY_03975 [Candidatus Hodarchaeales archaeon]